jgi:ATP-dependent Clp protease ATP-binding subunit ClpB
LASPTPTCGANRELTSRCWGFSSVRQRHSIELTWSAEVVDMLQKEYDVHYGARSLQHAIDQLVINPIAAAHEQASAPDLLRFP